MSLRPQAPGTSLRAARVNQVSQSDTKPGRNTKQTSAKRVLSLDRLDVNTPSDVVSLGVKKIKCSPRRAPLKEIRNCEAAQNGGLRFNNEKVRAPVYDKLTIQVQANLITEYLRVIEPVLGKNFFTRGGLKSMSNKQFTVIVNHFFELIAGNRLFVGENYIEDIIKALSKIGYPYIVNKSWLKTPSVPHVFGNIVVMLRWLQTFSCSDFSINQFETNYFLQGEDFPDEEFARLFMTEIKEGFMLWNNSKDREVEDLKQGLVDKIIMKRTGLQGQKEIEKVCAGLKLEIKRIRRHKPVITNEKESIELHKEVEAKSKLLLKLKEEFQNGQRKLTAIQNSVVEKEASLNNAKLNLADIEQIVNTQEVTIQERDKLISEVKDLKQFLSSKRKLVSELLDMAASKQVLFSRLKYRSIQLISSYNNYLSQVFEEFANTENGILEELILDQKQPDEIFTKLDIVEPLLQNLRKTNLTEYNKYANSLYKLENDLKIKVCEYDKVLVPKLNLERTTCSDLEGKIKHINIQIAKVHAQNKEELENRKKTLNILVDRNSEITKHISKAEEELKALKCQNELMMARITSKVNETLTIKENRLEQLNDAVNSLVTTLEDVALSLDGARKSLG